MADAPCLLAPARRGGRALTRQERRLLAEWTGKPVGGRRPIIAVSAYEDRDDLAHLYVSCGSGLAICGYPRVCASQDYAVPAPPAPCPACHGRGCMPPPDGSDPWGPDCPACRGTGEGAPA